MTSTMSPAEILARIRYDELGFDEPYEDVQSEIRADEERIARKMIRALADIHPSRRMREIGASCITDDEGIPFDAACDIAAEVFATMLNAAAAEGKINDQ